MSTKVRLPKAQDDDDLSPPRRRPATPDHFIPSRRGNSSSSPRRNDRHSRLESSPSSVNRRRSKQESSRPPLQPAKLERRLLAEHQEKIAERYAQWGRGLAQVQQSEDAVKYYLEQSEKPLARYRDDKDLDTMLKQQEREGKLTN
jgi:pre-mRNA-splicing factor CWC26